MPLIVTENAAAPTGPTEAGSGLNSSRRWPGLCLALFSALYFVPAFIHAARDKLWFDEILTFDAASLLPSFRTLWSFLKQGVEFNPPLSFLLAGLVGEHLRHERVWPAVSFHLRILDHGVVSVRVLAAPDPPGLTRSRARSCRA